MAKSRLSAFHEQSLGDKMFIFTIYFLLVLFFLLVHELVSLVSRGGHDDRSA